MGDLIKSNVLIDQDERHDLRDFAIDLQVKVSSVWSSQWPAVNSRILLSGIPVSCGAQTQVFLDCLVSKATLKAERVLHSCRQRKGMCRYRVGIDTHTNVTSLLLSVLLLFIIEGHYSFIV